MIKLYVDFETYFDTASGYDLKSMSMTEYIRDERFHVLGCGIRDAEREYLWLRDNELRTWIATQNWADMEMIAHNVKFDGAIFAWRYGIVPGRYFDTKALARAVLGQDLSGYSLRNVAKHLGLPPKGDLNTDGKRELTESEEKTLIDYNRQDLLLCNQLDDILRPAFPSSQLASLDWTIKAFTEPVLRLDVERLERMVENDQQEKAALFKKLGIPKSEFSSQPKFANLLVSRGIEVPTKSSLRTGKIIPALSLADPGFIALKEACPDLYKARVAAKSTITETRGISLSRVGQTGAFPFDAEFSGAIGTHRYSGGSGAGGNPQNFPNEGEIRKSVTVPAGSSLVVGDFSAIEDRINMWLAKEPRGISEYMQGKDRYCSFASEIYRKSITKKEHPKERKVGKECILGLGYQMGWVKLRNRIKLKLGEDVGDDGSRRIVTLYRATHPNVPLLWENAAYLIPQMAEGREGFVPFAPFLKIKKNALVLPSGLVIKYPNLRQVQGPKYKEWVYDVWEGKHLHQVKLYGGKLVENICQALAGEICKISIDRTRARGLRIVGQVHDEILCVAERERAQDVATILRECMETSVGWWPELRLASEVKVGQTWAEAKGG